jgi:hypothetical protein
MTIAAKDRNHGRQWPLVATQEFTLAQLTSGEAVPAVRLPGGARVISGFVRIDEAFDSDTSDELDIGDGDDPDRYTTTEIDLQASAGTVGVFTITGYRYPTSDYLDLTWTSGGGTPTTGKATMVVQYIIDGRTNELTPDYDLVNYN